MLRPPALALSLTVLVSLLTVSLGDADPRNWMHSPTQWPVPRGGEGQVRWAREVEGRADWEDAGRASHRTLPQGVARGGVQNKICSEWHDMRVQFNRAMGQMQSGAQKPSAKEELLELNWSLMHVLSQSPLVEDDCSERRALLANLKRISQLQKDNLTLRLQHVVKHPSTTRRSGRGGEGDNPLQYEGVQQETFTQYWQQHSQQKISEHQPQPQHTLPPPMAATTRVMPPSRTIGGRSSVPLDEYAFHRRQVSLIWDV